MASYFLCTTSRALSATFWVASFTLPLTWSISPEGYIYSDSRCYSVIFVDQSAESGNPDYLTVAAVSVWL